MTTRSRPWRQLAEHIHRYYVMPTLLQRKAVKKRRMQQTAMFEETPEQQESRARVARPTAKWTLGSAREWLRSRINKGVRCPCCGQHAKVYKRPLNSSMAHALILLARAPLERMDTEGYIHVPSYLNECGLNSHAAAAIRGDWAKLVHWDLIEKPPQREREDGSARTGEWRLTMLGSAFVNRQVRVLSHLRIYDSEALGLTGKHVWITEVLADGFDYAEIMKDAASEPTLGSDD